MLKKNLKSAASALFGALLVVVLTGCGASGLDAPTRNVKQVTDGVEATSGGIKAVNVLLVTQGDGSAVLVGTLINSDEVIDSITGITANGIAGEISAITLATDLPVIFAGDSANSTARFQGLNAKASNRVNLEISFASAAPIKVSALVRAKAEIYANVGD
ncbi:MAG: hypothetical protein D4R69_03890 [Actinomycetales bacterium]|jgi:hypothetical protein|nr:MAG: hypothetical protein D4R69_03890 [Actinomycetales bacterium]